MISPNFKVRTKFKVFLEISDFECDLMDVSKIMGREPTSSRKKGELVGKEKRKTAERNIWRVESTLADQFNLNIHVQSLLSEFETQIELLRQQVPNFLLLISCVVMWGTDEIRPILSLTEDSIRRMADISASFEIDYYN